MLPPAVFAFAAIEALSLGKLRGTTQASALAAAMDVDGKEARTS